ncbi:CAAD domain-containing protein [Geminocystis sp. CENA526]|uniref:CAAD domain-containing protein n=1 Tax=Geminocystis sp. CENA526 TaxID=1355871 RepID=UPI003D6E5C0E
MESQSYEKETQTQESSAFNDDVAGVITTATSPVSSSGDADWQEWVNVVVDYLAKLPDTLGNFFSDYKQPLTTFGLIITATITVYVTLSVLDAIDNIPLLSSVLELVGLGYSAWFVARYLLKASTRQELFSEFDSLKKQVLGGKSQ